MKYTKVDLRGHRLVGDGGVEGGGEGGEVGATGATAGPGSATLGASVPEPSSSGSLTPVLTIPCPLCQHVFECPFARQPREECLDLWPLASLGRGRRREADGLDPGMRQAANADGLLRAVLEAWEGGGHPSDGQYLALRARALEGYPEAVPDPRVIWVLRTVLGGLTDQLAGDAIDYYGLRPADPKDRERALSRLLEAAKTAFEGALVLVRDDMVALDTDAPVGSHFERLFGDCFRLILWRLLGVEELTLPDAAEALKDAVEGEWLRALRYGNGLYGLSVVPRVSILDLIRYQELHEAEPVISRSIAEYYMLLLSTFPHLVQLVAPQFGEVVTRQRLAPMFEPLVRRCAWRAVKRLRMTDGEAVPHGDRGVVEQQFRGVLVDALQGYDFLHGKTVGPAGVAGQVGTSGSPEARARLQEALAFLDLTQTPHDLTHVNVARFVQARLDDHLRTHYPVPDRNASRQQSLDAVADEGGEGTVGDQVAGPRSLEPGTEADADDPNDWLGTTGAQVSEVFACAVNGVRYRFTDEMARRAGVTSDQLRRWDTRGDLPAQRLGDLEPSRQDTPCADWRVYPETPEMVAAIRELADRKARRRTGMAQDEYTRTGAARILGVAPKTLERWEKDGIATPLRRGTRLVYTEEEITRLAPRSPRTKA